MTKGQLRGTWIAALTTALAAALVACGGGGDPVEEIAYQKPLQAPGASARQAALVTADMTMDWAEYRFPELFGAASVTRYPSIEYEGRQYNARAYDGSWGTRYLGITPDGRVYGLGDFTEQRLQQFETIEHWAAEVLRDWCRVRPADCAGAAQGYGSGAVVPPAMETLSRTEFSEKGEARGAGLADGTRADLGAQASGFGMQLEREAGIEPDIRAALAQHPGLRATGSVRGLYVAGSKETTRLKPRLVVPAREASGLNPDALAIVRVGPAIVNGSMVDEHVSLLPVMPDTKGNLSFIDPLFRDGVYTPDQLQSAGSVGPAPRARALAARRADAAGGYEWIGGARYVLATFQGDVNWAREPELVRMIPDASYSTGGWRRPVSEAERQMLLRQPVCNLVLLVHGHNEEEKGGSEQATEAAPWHQAYKKRVWDLLYQQALADGAGAAPAFPRACTAFYEFIYPTYRAIFSPVSQKGAGVQETLGEALGRLVTQEISGNPQLAATLARGMPMNVVLVGHSQGGLVARAGLRFMPEAFKSRIQRLITWGSPHHGAPLYTMRFAMQAGHDLIIDGYRLPLQNLVQAGIASTALDTPGIRDLRLDARHQSAINLRALFPGMDAAAEAALATTLYSSNLGEFNTNVGTREIDPGPHYVFFTGTKRKSAALEIEDASAGWWAQLRGQQVARFASSTGTERGAALNRLLMKSGFQASDGAAPLFSQQGAGIHGPEALDMGDVDHEEFYGAEPPQRNAASLGKGRATVERTFTKARLDAAESACPSIQDLSLSGESDPAVLSGRVVVPSLAKTPGRIGAMIQRVEARAGSSTGSVVAALNFRHDADGRFSASAPRASLPVGAIAVVAVLQDGSEIQASVSHDGPSGFIAARLWGQPWRVTENRDGVLRAKLNRQDDGRNLQCTLAIDWTLPATHAQALQMRIVRLLEVDGVVRHDSFFVRHLSYGGRVMPRSPGEFASRSGTIIDPPATLVRTDQGIQRDISYLPPERSEEFFYEKRPTLYLEVKGLCGAAEATEIRFDYAQR